jgi:ribosomal protein S18 acetylase RimI-like enzyme
MDYEFTSLSFELLQIHLKDLLAIDEKTLGEKWERRHFLLDLPGKWEYSVIAFDAGKPAGFVIASIKSEGLHVHRIVVASSYQGRGLGTQLLQRVAQSALQRDISLITLRVAAQNLGAIRFYNRLGFCRELTESDLLNLYVVPEVLLARGASSNNTAG